MLPDTVLHAETASVFDLPALFESWFRHKGWQPHPHQRAMLAAATDGAHALLIAPTGGGKTLAGFLPTLVDLAERPRAGLHTLYVSPLKALAVDIHRNLDQPIAEMRLPIRHETRTGDTPPAKRERQRKAPPHILLTTPESLALMLSYTDADRLFAGLRRVIVDELHALVGSKRGDQLALCLARLGTLSPAARRVGLSATVADEDGLMVFLSRTGRSPAADVRLVRGRTGAAAQVEILETDQPMPWSGHMGIFAIEAVYARIVAAGTTLVFVNTRAQAEIVFQALWRINEDALPIALHHGSLAVEQRRKVEAAMAEGRLRAVVATSSLDLGIDWAEVDLVIQIGAPKGVSRLLQRIGRANHRLDSPSRALLVPANRFEVLECRAALDSIVAGELDGEGRTPGGLDVLAQHLLLCACHAPLDAAEMYAEVVSAAPYADLTQTEFGEVLAFVATGGYALMAYDRFRRLVETEDGRWRIASPAVARSARMNTGTIVQAETLKVRLHGRGPVLGEVEEYFASVLRPGDTFMFAGQLLRFLGLRDMTVEVARGGEGEPAVPAYAGGKFPLSTHLADRVRAILAHPDGWTDLPAPVQEWLTVQRLRSLLPRRDNLLVETFPRGGKHYLVAYCFEGRNAHQTLGMLLTRRMERAGFGPLGFVATDYVIAVWGLHPPVNVAALFDQDMLGDDLEAWMDESSLMRRTFRTVAVIAGLIERRSPGQEKSGKQVTFNADLIYDVLRRHDPEHILLRATRRDAAKGLTDIGRLSAMLARVRGRIVHTVLERVSPLAVPVLLEVGREQVYGSALDELLDEAEDALLTEAMPELSGGGDGGAGPGTDQSTLPL